ncbi:hypothetical protein [Mesorhizobium sp. WSM3882]|uniref:hypothetical protein n=1 Tax=Mesorhizobium sp. WSM3882 TaxID=2029407 RepID=UPI00117CBE6B|nr:hypothetical protein [Mesorhizobium sp. WSM3882]
MFSKKRKSALIKLGVIEAAKQRSYCGLHILSDLESDCIASKRQSLRVRISLIPASSPRWHIAFHQASVCELRRQDVGQCANVFLNLCAAGTVERPSAALSGQELGVSQALLERQMPVPADGSHNPCRLTVLRSNFS